MKISSLSVAALACLFCIEGYAAEKVHTISIHGNRELPKSLIIVPWKAGDVSDEPNLPEKSLIDERFKLVERSQFLREIQSYKLKK